MIGREVKMPRLRLVIVMFAICQIAPADSVIISIVSASQSVGLGSSVSVGLKIAGLGDHTSPSLGTFDLNLDFDQAVLSYRTATFGDPALGDQLDPTGSANVVNLLTPGIGSIELLELSLDDAATLDSLQAGSFTLATIDFTTAGVGTSPLTLSINALGDEFGNSLAATLQDTSVSVVSSSIPEPSSCWLTTAVLFLVSFLAFERRTSVKRRRGKLKTMLRGLRSIRREGALGQCSDSERWL